MAQRILSVDVSSLAARAGIRAGDELLLINNEPVIDVLDYQYLTAGGKLTLRLRREGREFSLSLRKREYADIGLNFADPLMSGLRRCCNHCLFCFVDQLPERVRESMRIKDDDWRMSLMTGSYVTLTNVGQRGLERIVARRASPLYISVHAADPALRSRILGTPRAGELMNQLRFLSENGIEFHTQAVLCPGLNDGDALRRTVEEVAALSGALSLALVPVGLTRHREGLYPLRPYTREEARDVLRIAEEYRPRFLSEKGTRFVFPSDEFYVLAEEELPSDGEYEEYAQIDDGVGLLRLLEREFSEAYQDADWEIPKRNHRLTAACGVSAAPYLQKLFAHHPIPGLEISVKPIVNIYFGDSVTVSGLVTAEDLLAGLAGDESECVLITCVMLRDGGDRFLDDVSLKEAMRRLHKKIIPVGRSGEELLSVLADIQKQA